MTHPTLLRDSAEERVESDPVVGWRAWHVRDTEDGPALAGLRISEPRKLPSQQGFIWVPGGSEAECGHGETAPCYGGCGFYALTDESEAGWENRPDGFHVSRTVFGHVALWGSVKRYEGGFIRGQYARPLELWNVDGKTAADLGRVYGVTVNRHRQPAAAARAALLRRPSLVTARR